MSNYQYYIILDFEATCDNKQKPKPQEIIEFPSVIIEAKTNQVVTEFQRYVKPVFHPHLTDFCTKLTGITQQQVNNGVTIHKAIKDYDKWLLENNLFGTKFIIVTVGDWDLGTMFPEQCKISKIKPNSYFKQWINIKNEFKNFYNIQKRKGMVGMLNYLGIKLTGHHHSGIDDCRNTAKIWQHMINDGYKVNTDEIRYLYN